MYTAILSDGRITVCSIFFILMSTQAANILFALCGIVGPLYGIGQTFKELDPKNIQTAMFVCRTLSGPSPSKYRCERKTNIIVFSGGGSVRCPTLLPVSLQKSPSHSLFFVSRLPKYIRLFYGWSSPYLLWWGWCFGSC